MLNDKATRRKKNLIRILCIFFLSILWFSMVALVELYGGAFLKERIISLMAQSNVYEHGYTYFQEQIKETINNYPIPIEQVTDVLTLQRYYVARSNYVQRALSGRQDTSDYEEIRRELKQQLIQYLNEGNSSNPIKEEQTIEAFVARAMNLFYESTTSTLLDSIFSLRVQFLNLVKWIIPIITICSIQFLLILFRVHSNKERVIRDISYSCLASLLMAITLYIWIRLRIQSADFCTGPEFYQSFIENYISHIKDAFIYGIWFLGLLFCILIAVRQILQDYLEK